MKVILERFDMLKGVIVLCMIGILLLGNQVQAAGLTDVKGSIKDSNGVVLEWESDDEESQFTICKSTKKDGEYRELATLSGQKGTVQCYDYEVTFGKTYYYKVVRMSGEEIMEESPVIAVKIVLPAPDHVKAKKVKESRVKITWSAVKKASGYTIYRSTKKKKGFKKIATAKTNQYTDYNVKKGKAYFYKVVANYKKNKSYNSAKSESASVYMKPATPAVTAAYVKKKIKLSWNQIDKAQKYLVYKKNQSGKFVLLAETSKLSYTDSKVKKGKTYEYKVVAVCDVGGKSVKSKASSICKIMASTINPNQKMVALTFDDGPGPYTKEIVACLKKNNAKATFFVLGCNVDSYKSAVKEASKIGCEIGNHSYSHPNMANLSAKEIQSEIERTDSKVKKITGKAPTIMRTPGGAVNSTVKDNVGKPIIMWSIDTLDWKHRNTNKTIQTVLSQVKDGDIVLMHDIHAPTKDAALSLIVTLRRQGYQLVTVSELAQYRGYQMKKGTVYYNFRK